MADAPETSTPETPVAPAATAQQWRDRVSRAEKRQAQWHGWWKAAFDAYAPSVKDNPDGYRETIHTNRTFTIVERKSAELFYQQPELTVSPSPLLEAMGDAGTQIASAHGHLLNAHLGRDGVNCRQIARRAILDYLLCGIGGTELGFRSYTKDTPSAVPVLDPVTQQPVLDPLTGQPQTEIQVVPVPVKQEVFWENLSPKQILLPADWTGWNFDESPWIGVKFTSSTLECRRLYGDKIPKDFAGSGRQEDVTFDPGDQPDRLPSSDQVTGVKIWYKTAQFDEAEAHPDHLTRLILIDGIADPVEQGPSPDQSFDQQGKLTPDSLEGYPVHPLAIRTLTDSAYVVSDVAMALPLIQELDKFRTQMVQQRDATILRYFHNTDVLPNDKLEEAIASPLGGSIGLDAAAFADFNRVIQAMPHGPFPRENFTMNDYIDNDLARTHAIDGTSSGTTETSITATEANLRQANVNARLGWEQGFVADWFVAGATKYATLMQRYLSVEDAAQIIGQPAAQAWDSWRRTAAADVAFTMVPDSSLRNDTPLDRKQLQDVYTFLANDPTLNRAYLTKKLLTKYHLDPAQAILPAAQVPKPKPQPPAASLSFKGEDFSPLSPQAPIMLDLWQKISGIQIDPDAITNAMALGQAAMLAQKAEADAKAAGQPKDQPPHGGKVAPIESLSKHATDQTGAMQGSGAMTPGMAGGMVQ